MVLRVLGPGNKPIRGVQVAAFTDFESRRGAGGVTDAKGRVALKIPKGKVERLYLYPPAGFWPGLRLNIKLGGVTDISLTPIDLVSTSIACATFMARATCKMVRV